VNKQNLTYTENRGLVLYIIDYTLNNQILMENRVKQTM